MSTRIYGGTHEAVLAEDDDWFATGQQQAAEPADTSWENELEWQLRDPAPPDLAWRQGTIVLAVVVAVFLVFAGILIGRETKGSTTKVVTATTPQAETPAAAGAQDNSAATSTPSSSTPSSSTPSSSTPSSSTTGSSTSSSSTPSSSTPGSTTPSTASPPSSAVPSAATLRPGATGEAVVTLQEALTTLGYAPGTADGTYGATTAQAVTAFQTAKNLTADGLAGATTLAAINAALASG